MTQLSTYTVAQFAYDQGLRGESIAVAVAIAWAESNLETDAHDDNPKTGDDSWGLWQINLYGSLGPGRRKQFNLVHDSDLTDPVVNAYAMRTISGGGNTWTPWSTYKSGKYLQYMAQASAAALNVLQAAGDQSASQVSSQVGPDLLADLGASGDITGDYFVSPDELSDYDPSTFADQLRIMGLLASAAPQLTGGKVDLSTDKVTEMALDYHDPINHPAGDVLLLSDLTWRSLDMTVTAREYDASQIPEKLTVTAQTKGVSKMREIDPTGQARAWTAASPTEVMAQRATDAGLRFIGKGSERRQMITRHGKSDTGATKAESDWDMGARLAGELGYWFFEVDGVVVFAPPSWIVGQFPQFQVRWRPSAGDQIYRALTVDARVSINTSRGLGQTLWPRTLSFTLPRARGERVRPGMLANFKGLPGFEAAYLVTNVSWPLNDYTTPVTIDAVEPVDPVATDPLGLQETPDPNAPTQGTGAANVANAPGGGGLAPTALDFTTLCLQQVGDRYVLGAAHDAAALANPNPTAFDCSGLVGWACYRLGVSFTGTAGSQMRQVINAGLEIPVDRAAATRGAILYRGTLNDPSNEHIAVSLGDGKHTVEAMGKAYGVVQGDIGNRFTRGGRIPGLDYSSSA